MTNITEWYDEIRSKVPGCSDDLISQELKHAIRVFSKDSHAYIVDVNDIGTTASTASVVLNPSEGTVLAVLAAWYEGVPMELILTPVLGSTTPAEGTPSKILLSHTAGTITLVPTPAETKTAVLDFKVAVKPSSDAAVPDHFYNHWRDEIMYGCLFNLYSMPGKPFTAPSQAAYYGRKFRSAIAEARDIMRSRYSSAILPWQFPQGQWI